MCVYCRCDLLKRQYTGAVCGLGFCKSTGQSLFIDHDIEITFDTVLTQQDIKLVCLLIVLLCLSTCLIIR